MRSFLSPRSAVSILYSTSFRSQLLQSCIPRQVLRLLVKLYEEAAEPDWASICQCLMFLDDGPEVAKIFDRLLRGSEVTAYCCHPGSRWTILVHSLAWTSTHCESKLVGIDQRGGRI